MYKPPCMLYGNNIPQLISLLQSFGLKVVVFFWVDCAHTPPQSSPVSVHADAGGTQSSPDGTGGGRRPGAVGDVTPGDQYDRRYCLSVASVIM